jgi:hypothetical protein
MTHSEIISEVLEEQNGLCDACLVNRTRITPHQAVNAGCRTLEVRGALRRERQVCSGCQKIRLTNLLNNIPIAKPSPLPEVGKSQAGTASWLDDVRRTVIGHLNNLEGTSPKGEPFSRRVLRMRDQGKIPPEIACLIQLSNGLRNLACYEGYALGDKQSQIVAIAYSEILRWMKK